MKRALQPCNEGGCNTLTRNRGGRCDAHQRGSTWNRWQRGRTRQERGYGAAWERIRLAILQRDRYLCQECKRQGRFTQLVVGNRAASNSARVDHIVPKARGGTNDEANLEALCRLCHDAKTALERLA
jgi:5-methylcytosine-specific restriction enzyme A